MVLPFAKAMQFIKEAMQRRGQEQEDIPNGISDVAGVPMKYANAFELQVSEDGYVTFLNGARQVLRFCCLENNFDIVHELDECENRMDVKALMRLQKLEKKRTGLSKSDTENSTSIFDLRCQVAAIKLQRSFRAQKRRKLRTGATKSSLSLNKGEATSELPLKGASSSKPGLNNDCAEADAGKDAGRGIATEDAPTGKVGAPVGTPPVAG
jgi:hypothetical protein